MHLSMDASESFRLNLIAERARQDLTAAEVSRRAGLNVRAVKDIEERRAQSPKISTVFAISHALGVDPGEMMGLGKRPALRAELADFLAQYDEDDQARLLAALEALTPPRNG